MLTKVHLFNRKSEHIRVNGNRKAYYAACGLLIWPTEKAYVTHIKENVTCGSCIGSRKFTRT